jgi:hypothetical protein
MQLLHVQTLRPGADGIDPKSAHAVNYDEAKANPWPKLPDALVLADGQPVTTADEWWGERRPQIVALFDHDVYGKVPADVPAVRWEVVSTAREMVGDVPVVTKKLIGQVDNSADPAIDVDIHVTLTTPAQAAGPVPVILELSWPALPKPRYAPPTDPSWQELALAKGWGYASMLPTDVQPDSGAGLTEGIIGLTNHGQPRGVDDWGALRAWAWGASRALDYFETDKAVDAKRVGIAGHSRYGKAALVAMAYDQRFAIAYISSSGMGGAALYRRNFGERLENVAGVSEYHWMAGNFLKYAGPLTPNDLPVDANELIALCAPRPVFIGAGATEGDGWADARGMFMAEAAASPVYTLLGKPGLVDADGKTAEFPEVETALVGGELGFRQHTGGHTPTPNWPTFLDFASRYFAQPQEKHHLRPRWLTFKHHD